MTQEPWEAAIENFDWGQPVGRDWNPCFRIMEDGQCCGRAERWAGHEPGKDHTHLSLLQFIQQVRGAQANVEEKKAAFLEAAMEWCCALSIVHGTLTELTGSEDAADGPLPSAKLIRAYRALVEAEKGEGPR